jgi:hypothetical protein
LLAEAITEHYRVITVEITVKITVEIAVEIAEAIS